MSAAKADPGTVVRYVPASFDRFDDVAQLLSPGGLDTPVCWCLSYRVTSSEFNALRGSDRPARLRTFFHGAIAPGMLAYVADQPAGWCAFGPRTEMGRLQRSRTIQRVDDQPVWSIVCFVVRSQNRRQGIARGLLHAAVDYLGSAGVEVLEGYPVDNDGRRLSSSFAYTGTVRMFESAGFERVVATSATTGRIPRWIMRRNLRTHGLPAAQGDGRVTP
jgi:GNAT superfamily N-acetyltransferase